MPQVSSPANRPASKSPANPLPTQPMKIPLRIFGAFLKNGAAVPAAVAAGGPPADKAGILPATNDRISYALPDREPHLLILSGRDGALRRPRPVRGAQLMHAREVGRLRSARSNAGGDIAAR